MVGWYSSQKKYWNQKISNFNSNTSAVFNNFNSYKKVSSIIQTGVGFVPKVGGLLKNALKVGEDIWEVAYGANVNKKANEMAGNMPIINDFPAVGNIGLYSNQDPNFKTDSNVFHANPSYNYDPSLDNRLMLQGKIGRIDNSDAIERMAGDIGGLLGSASDLAIGQAGGATGGVLSDIGRYAGTLIGKATQNDFSWDSIKDDTYNLAENLLWDVGTNVGKYALKGFGNSLKLNNQFYDVAKNLGFKNVGEIGSNLISGLLNR
jgi:hypothetical protein